VIGDPLDISTDGDVVVAALRGDIDLSNAKMISNSIGESVPNGAAGVVLDLVAVTYLDSSGVHLVFDLNERLEGRQQRLAIALPEDSRISRVLDLVNVGAVVPIETTVKAALERVREAEL
jgi:anti-anti-sigma factor